MEFTERQLTNFWLKVRKTESCWLWIGAAHKRMGHGAFNISGKSVDAHRVSWMIHQGTIPPGMHICHTCDNPPCVNPAHLFMGTHLDNMHDMTKKKRYASYPGEKHPNARLKEGEVWLIRRLFDCGVPHNLIAKMFRASSGSINLIGRRLSWIHLPEVQPTHPIPRYIHKTRQELGSSKGTRNGRAILSEDDVRDIRVRLAAGELGWVVARRYRVSSNTVSKIKTGGSWSHVA